MTTSFGARLRAARLAAGLTQIELARGIVTTSQLSLMEHDKRRPSPGTLSAIAHRLHLPPVELAFGGVARDSGNSPLAQARMAVAQRDYARAERIATGVIRAPLGPERIAALTIRAAAREGQRRVRAALDDLQRAHELAKQFDDTAAAARLAVACARLRAELQADDAA